MTGDQGAVLLCVQRNMNAFVPPRPCPRLCSGCTASGDRRSNAVLLCVQRNMNAFVPPHRPCPRLLLQMTDDRRSRCSAFVCAEEHERFCPPLPKTIASDDRRSRCSAFVCAEEHERFCPPPRPCPRLC